jgi:hypothetical protein
MKEDDQKSKAIDKLYIDEPCVVSFFIGEIGWFLQRWQGYLRHLKLEKLKDHKFILMMNSQLHVLVHDFVSYTIDLPQEFYALRLETDCYEAPIPGSPPGSLTPPDVYKHLIEYFRNFYNKDKAIEVWTPRGPDTLWIDHQKQVYARYTRSNPQMKTDRPIVTVCPRGRSRAAFRNVPEFVWNEAVDKLAQDFVVVLCGTPSGSFLSKKTGENIINLISYNGDDKFDLVLEYMCNSICNISSQSGLTHVGLFCDCPSYIIGHEKERHAIVENRLETPVSFRYVPDYRMIDAETICSDLASFFGELSKRGLISPEGQKTEDVFDRTLEQDQKIFEELTNGNNK